MEQLTSVLNEKKSIGFYLYSNWIFTSLLEKALLTTLIGFGVWKVINLLSLLF